MQTDWRIDYTDGRPSVHATTWAACVRAIREDWPKARWSADYTQGPPRPMLPNHCVAVWADQESMLRNLAGYVARIYHTPAWDGSTNEDWNYD